MYLKITPEMNLDGDDIIRDPSLVRDLKLDWNQGIEVKLRETGQDRPIMVRDLSIFEHSIILHDEPHRIISIFSKEDF